uniref:Uncharacterized protein n=1 Tax=Physcomitrium patens TaxID=3218 RepID=A0A2K1JJE2_PHYPA|nr:hypothetical protein PHYPA_019078 [Physcomitrium patens]
MDVQDIIGAAETGSRKTVVVGLPMLRWLLDEHEKIQRKSGFDKASKKQSGGPLRVLIVIPTKELLLFPRFLKANVFEIEADDVQLDLLGWIFELLLVSADNFIISFDLKVH